jgi:hypothetical protein
MRGSDFHSAGRGIMLLVVSIAALVLAPSAYADGVPLAPGDVLADVGQGQIRHFSNTGTLLDTLDTTTGTSEGDGMCLDGSSNLYATQGFSADIVSKFDKSGHLVAANFGSGYDGSPESCAVDGTGNVYVGQPDGSHHVLTFDSSGTLLASFAPAIENRGTDWIDLASDQCTLHYTSEGTSIKQFNVCTNTQLPDFATGLPGGRCYGHRVLPDGGELAACTSEVVRLDPSGSVIQTYTLPGTSFLFAMNLDPDGKTFWTADYSSGAIFRVDIATGSVVTTFTSTPNTVMGGLTVVGELTAAIDPKIAAAGAGALQGTAGQPVSGTVATFTDPDTNATAGEYSASISWGDGSASAGTISGSGGGFTVSAAHTYASPGSYAITVTISDLTDSGNSATITDQANIASHAGRPSIVGGPPIKTTTSRASLAASVNPDGLLTTYNFEYGLDSRYRIRPTSGIVYDQRTADQLLAANSPATAVAATATELVPNALYHARLVATNSAGSAFAPDQTFRTGKDLKTPPKPVLGKSFDGALVSGLVLVKPPAHASARASGGRRVRVTLPNNHGYFPLTEPLSLPAGTKIEALRGSLRLLTASGQKDRTYSGVFGSGLFSVRQAARGATRAVTTLALLEGAFSGAPTYSSCTAKARKAVPLAGVARLSAKVLQTLRSTVHGRFRTRGRYSASTVRGTGWDTSDRCDGTLTVVHRGTVQVSDFARRVTVAVHAGHRYLAHAVKPAHK